MAVNQKAVAEPLLIKDEDTSFADSLGNESHWEVSDLQERTLRMNGCHES